MYVTFRRYLWGSALQRFGENVLRQPFPGLFDTLNNWSCTANYKHDVAYFGKNNKRIRDVKRELVQLGPEVGCRIIQFSVRLCCPS